MDKVALGSLLMQQAAAGPARKTDESGKIQDAAQQFEALLMSQILRSARESGGGWTGGDDSASGDCATDFAEQQFAAVLAKQGGLGLSGLIASGLRKPR